jgi:hypothetical protein
MDYLEPSEVLRAIARTIEDDVLPRVEDAYARSQLWSAAGLLANLAIDLAPDAPAPGPALAGDLEDALAAEPGLAEVAARLREELLQANARTASLHYRRAVSGAPADPRT